MGIRRITGGPRWAIRDRASGGAWARGIAIGGIWGVCCWGGGDVDIDWNGGDINIGGGDRGNIGDGSRGTGSTRAAARAASDRATGAANRPRPHRQAARSGRTIPSTAKACRTATMRRPPSTTAARRERAHASPSAADGRLGLAASSDRRSRLRRRRPRGRLRIGIARHARSASRPSSGSRGSSSVGGGGVAQVERRLRRDEQRLPRRQLRLAGRHEPGRRRRRGGGGGRR